MLFDILQTITEFVVLLTRLTTEELADEQRMALIDQLIHFQGLATAFQFDLHDMLMILITMLSTSFGWRGIVRTVGRIADSNRAQTLERHRSLHAVLFASRRVWLRVTKRALPGEAPARSIFKLVSQGGTPISATVYRLIEEIVRASEKKLAYLGWAMYGENVPSHPIHTLSSCEQTRVWEVMTARKAAILLPRIYARLLTICGQALPVDWFILPTVFKEFLELPRLRKALSVVLNKRRASARNPLPARSFL